MFVVCINTFEWTSLRRLKRMPKPDAAIMIAVTVVTIFTGLAVAIICGVIISALVLRGNMRVLPWQAWKRE